MRLKCYTCQGPFGLWRHNKHGKQFCCTNCVATYENVLRDKMKQMETRHKEFLTWLHPTSFANKPP